MAILVIAMGYVILMYKKCVGVSYKWLYWGRVMNWYLFFYYQVPELCEDLLSSVDQPLKIARDKETSKDYLLCDYNRDGDSYR